MLSVQIKEPGSALTHFIALQGALIMTPVILLPLIYCGADSGHIVGISVFMSSMILLYAASTLYHTLTLSAHATLVLKKLDHMMISVLIGGSYTPICLTALRDSGGRVLLIVVWILAAAGMIFKLFWVTCPKWVSSVIYIGMGWVCILALPQLMSALKPAGFGWLLAGGLFYTVGGVIYATRVPVFRNRFSWFGSHELFHVFVMAGSICHFIVMNRYL